MNLDSLLTNLDCTAAGREMHDLASELYPICRSITGDGVRQSLAVIGRAIPLEVHEVPSGTPVFDWTVPDEWNVRDAWVKDSRGNKVIDFQQCNLHVMSYSVPLHERMSLEALKPHLFTMPDKPDWIPYRTSYYKENWGFCLPHRIMEALDPGEYEVHIDSSLKPGSLTYAECVVPGRTNEEVLVSCHICHPSLANDNLSGVVIAAALARRLGTLNLKYSYRFLFVPGTVGSICWLARNEWRTEAIRAGLVLTCAGDTGTFTYKKSRQDTALIDRAMAHILRLRNDGSRTVDFSPYGYDERQYCSPGFNLPVGCLMRTEHGCFPEYHTSADNLDFIRPEHLAGTLATCLEAIYILEHEATYRNLLPKCEPHLGKRGLYNTIGGDGIQQDNLALLWVLNYSDGMHSLLEIAGRADMPFRVIHRAAQRLEEAGLLEAVAELRANAHLAATRVA